MVEFGLKNGNYESNDNRKGDKRKMKPNLAPNDVPYLLSMVSFGLSE